LLPHLVEPEEAWRILSEEPWGPYEPTYIFAKSSLGYDSLLSDISPSLNLTRMDSSTAKVLELKT